MHKHVICSWKILNGCTVLLPLQGDLQQLLLVPDPAAAAQYCQDYMPDCNRQLIYKLQTQDAEEVGRQPKGRSC